METIENLILKATREGVESLSDSETERMLDGVGQSDLDDKMYDEVMGAIYSGDTEFIDGLLQYSDIQFGEEVDKREDPVKLKDMFNKPDTTGSGRAMKEESEQLDSLSKAKYPTQKPQEEASDEEESEPFMNKIKRKGKSAKNTLGAMFEGFH
tara:strand:+ start:379 stop:837 length:459 start_codon:yes stop_codon:yes gene_type:complete